MKKHCEQIRSWIKCLHYLDNTKCFYLLLKIMLKALPKIFLEGLLTFNREILGKWWVFTSVLGGSKTLWRF